MTTTSCGRDRSAVNEWIGKFPISPRQAVENAGPVIDEVFHMPNESDQIAPARRGLAPPLHDHRHHAPAATIRAAGAYASSASALAMSAFV